MWRQIMPQWCQNKTAASFIVIVLFEYNWQWLIRNASVKNVYIYIVPIVLVNNI